MSGFQRIPVEYPDPDLPIVAAMGRTKGPVAYHQHTDADWEICYISTGVARLRVAGTLRVLQAGDLFVIRPDEPHGFVSWRGKRRALMFHATLLKTVPLRARSGKTVGLEVEGIRIPTHFAAAPRRRSVIEHAWERLEEESFGRETAKASMCAALLGELLLELARNVKEAENAVEYHVSPAARETVEGVCAEVRAKLDYPWTLSELVRRSGYSATQLSLLFHAATGMSPCRWLSEERVREARELLAQSDKNLTAIAIEVGFGSRSQFHRAFRQATGTTPSRYRAIVRH